MAKRSLYEATMAVVDEAEDEQDYFEGVQQLVNSGQAWHLEGSVGRACMDAINAGRVMLGKRGHRDFYGSYVPSRSEVEAGTRGSYKFVVEHNGKQWADRMKRVK